VQTRERIESNERIPAHLAEFALSELDGLPRGDMLCHGDLNPANVLEGASGPKVIDWVNTARGDPHADVARTLLLLRMGTPPPGTARVMAGLEGVGRRLMERDYLREYRRRRALDPVLLERWYTVRAADRFWENIVEEDDALIRLLESRREGAIG
jgi:aminoglycoside phosphotransferase (APT) family kinase protein